MKIIEEYPQFKIYCSTSSGSPNTVKLWLVCKYVSTYLKSFWASGERNVNVVVRCCHVWQTYLTTSILALDKISYTLSADLIQRDSLLRISDVISSIDKLWRFAPSFLQLAKFEEEDQQNFTSVNFESPNSSDTKPILLLCNILSQESGYRGYW